MMPVRAARISAGSAATRAACATDLLPLEIASSTLRNDERMRERRALLTRVRRAILRVAFLADLVLAIGVSVCVRPPFHAAPGTGKAGTLQQRRRDRAGG